MLIPLPHTKERDLDPGPGDAGLGLGLATSLPLTLGEPLNLLSALRIIIFLSLSLLICKMGIAITSKPHTGIRM